MRRFLLVMLVVLTVSSLALAAHVDSMLVEKMNGAKGLIPVIVEMNPGAEHVNVNALGGKLVASWDIINGFSAELPVAAIEVLAKNPNVFAISYDREITVELNIASQAVRANALWNNGINGAGIRIAIIDTGIYPHQDFGNRIIAWRDFVNNISTPYDDNGHGTHCASIAAGNNATYRGPAWGASLMGVKVLNSAGSGSITNIISGVNWAVNNGAHVISMSLGGTATQSSTTDPMCSAVRNAWDQGVIVVVAAGNSGPGSQTIATPGIEPKVITVGASDDRNTVSISDDIVANFSSRGPTRYDGWTKPDVLAPGVNIIAARNATTGHVSKSGTSMATPLVAGVAAQMKQANPSWSNNTIKTRLKNTARSLGYAENTQGKGIIDAYAAVYN